MDPITILITSNNYSGYTADVTFYPDTGGTINLGYKIVPLEYFSDFPYGIYNLYFSAFTKTCTLSVDMYHAHYLLQEDLSFLLQENGDKIEITH